MNELALFAGAGGGLLASRLLGWTTICAVENNHYCIERLMQRQNEGHLERFPIWSDVRSFQGSVWKSAVDIVTGGFPCQAFSTATHGISTAEDLWYAMDRIIGEVEPKIVFAENVSVKAISKAAQDCSERGYRTLRLALSAEDLGADHRRNRYWLLAYTDDGSQLLSSFYVPTPRMRKLHPSIWSEKPQGWQKESVNERHGLHGKESQETECGSTSLAVRSERNSAPKSIRPRMVDGVGSWVDRYRAIGNGQVPIVAATAFSILASEAIRGDDSNPR